MNSSPGRLSEFLGHMKEATERILEYTGSGKADFFSNALVQDGVIRNLEIIGEASRNIEKHFPSFAEKNPDLPLREAYLMRNFLSHGYFNVDLEVVWSTVENDLPELQRQVVTVLGEINDE